MFFRLQAMVNRGVFNIDDLVVVPRTGLEVILASGGPVMRLVTIEGDNGLCRLGKDLVLFKLVMLRKVVPIGPSDFRGLRSG